MEDNLKATDFSLEEFFQMIYREETGFAYIATKQPGTEVKGSLTTVAGTFTQHFFQWPEQKIEMLSLVETKSANLEVYFSPALFSSKDAQKGSVKGARVFWCEFDGNTPENIAAIPEPSVRVQSSNDGHEHWYWFVGSLQGAETLENVNRSLAYALDADSSGWDANQILRPINTINHKRNRPVYLKTATDIAVSPEDFAHIPQPPPVEAVPIPKDIPPVESVIPKYIFKDEVWVLFTHGMPEGKRSEALMSLGYYLAEMQLQNGEILALLYNADERWGKFKGRSDQSRRLMEIVTKARLKYPLLDQEYGYEGIKPLGFHSITLVETKVNWVYKGLLHDRGYALLTGPSGVGKTQFSLEAAEAAVLGRNFLGFEQEKKDLRIAFISLEMTIEEIQEFIKIHHHGYTDEELALLDENLVIYPFGEPLYLTDKGAQDWLESEIRDGEFDGVILDSLGSVTSGSLSEEQNAKTLMDWNDRFRKRLGCFTWFIHHHRKGNSENKTPNQLSDVYGSQYLTARTSTTLSLWPTSKADTLRLTPLKVRFTKRFQPMELFRDTHLKFHTKVSGITNMGDKPSVNVETTGDTPTVGGFKFKAEI